MAKINTKGGHDLPSLPSQHAPINIGKTGVLLINLGTPEATDYWSMRRYLKEFLSDKRVIETNRFMWWLILNCIVLTTRPKKSGHAYDQIWNRERNESPLKTVTRSQAEKLTQSLEDEECIIVDWAMRYGKPSIAQGIERLQGQGCDRILLVPLYPQYSASTTATVYDKAFDVLKTLRWQPTLRCTPPYHDNPAYITAIANSIEAHIATLSWQPEVIIASFHGLPKSYLEKGDPYHCHCQKTTRLLREKMGLSEDQLRLTFQSRFGKAEWLQPYTDVTVSDLAKGGVKNLLVVTPGFAADCVETLEEIALGVGDMFSDNGGKNFSVVACLNDSTASISLLKTMVMNELKGWV